MKLSCRMMKINIYKIGKYIIEVKMVIFVIKISTKI